MEKHFEEKARLETIQDEEERKKEEDRLNEQKKKHREHPKLHEPMHKPQLEEVRYDVKLNLEKDILNPRAGTSGVVIQ